MRSTAILFVLEHWRFFLGFLVFGVTAALILAAVKKAAAARQAKADEVQDRALDAEMAKIRAKQSRSP